MRVKTIYTDEHGPVVLMDDFDILQSSMRKAIESAYRKGLDDGVFAHDKPEYLRTLKILSQVTAHEIYVKNYPL